MKKLSEYPKRGISRSQFSDEKKVEEQEKKDGIAEVCLICSSKKFMITTMGLRVCCGCHNCIGFIL